MNLMARKKKILFCGAKAKQNNHLPCKKTAMKNGRCRFHGGLSTGPKTKEGKARIAALKYKHGNYSKEGIKEKKHMKEMLKWRDDLGEIVEISKHTTVFFV